MFRALSPECSSQPCFTRKQQHLLMYIPAAFRESNQEKLFDTIEQNSFGILVSQGADEPFATHLPLLLDRRAGPHGTLIGHVGRANPHWQIENRNVLAIFSGPHAYISPTWYEAENMVPTWNYVAVHAYGSLEVVASHEETVHIVRDFVGFYERSMPVPWTIGETDEFVDKLARSVVAFRIPISRLEGKWKLNQNHPVERQRKVIDALRTRPDHDSQRIAGLMAKNLLRQEPQ